jgi:hypothetical protein
MKVIPADQLIRSCTDLSEFQRAHLEAIDLAKRLYDEASVAIERSTQASKQLIEYQNAIRALWACRESADLSRIIQSN